MRVVLTLAALFAAELFSQQPVIQPRPNETKGIQTEQTIPGAILRGPDYENSEDENASEPDAGGATNPAPADGPRRVRRANEKPISPPVPRVPPGGSGSGKFLIGPDDTVTIVALNVDEINKQWRVGGAGDLSLPMIGRVHAAGLTVEQLENELASRLQKFVLDPHVTVFVSEFRSQPVTVTGDVLNPGTTQIQGPKNLFQVLMSAGGANDKATEVKLARRTDQGKIPLPGVTETQSGDYSVVELALKDVTDVRTPAANLVIRPFDVVTVVRDRSPKLVHIIGEIVRPGAVELITQPTVSLLQVVAVSGGLTHTATPRKIRVIHLGPDGGELSTTVVNLKSIMAGRAKDVRLGPGDVVVVPTSAFKSYLETASMSALTSGMYVILQRF